MEEHLQVLFQVEGNFPPLYWSESMREKKTHKKIKPSPLHPKPVHFVKLLCIFFPDKKIY